MKRCIKRLVISLIVLLMVGVMIPSSAIAEAVPSVSYCTHVQNVGWQNYVGDGEMSGTEGKSYRLEGIKIKLDASGYDLGISYQTHIQNIGWEAETTRGWKSNNAMSGTEGLSYRLEAIQIKLTGDDANKFDIYYQVHAQNIGWMGWAKNGESAGTAGYGWRLEGIRIVIVPAGSAAPGSRDNAFLENQLAPYDQIIAEYKTAEKSGYANDVVWSLQNVNKELSLSSYKTKLYYMIQDISGDSKPELVISMYDPRYQNVVHPDGFQIYDMYRLNGNTPERIFDIKTMGYRAIYTMCENNIIRRYGSGGYNQHRDTFYTIEGSTVSMIEEITLDGSNYYLNDENNIKRIITKDEANTLINSYIPRSDINWVAVE